MAVSMSFNLQHPKAQQAFRILGMLANDFITDVFIPKKSLFDIEDYADKKAMISGGAALGAFIVETMTETEKGRRKISGNLNAFLRPALEGMEDMGAYRVIKYFFGNTDISMNISKAKKEWRKEKVSDVSEGKRIINTSGKFLANIFGLSENDANEAVTSLQGVNTKDSDLRGVESKNADLRGNDLGREIQNEDKTLEGPDEDSLQGDENSLEGPDIVSDDLHGNDYELSGDEYTLTGDEQDLSGDEGFPVVNGIYSKDAELD